MSWAKLLSTTRIKKNQATAFLDGRHPFNSDHDKIIFSGAFRRLARKTQVHPLATNDHIHNRLTHSLEVACVGRSIGVLIADHLKQAEQLPVNIEPQMIGLVVEASCLAHDIGNPPFGHVGEEVIRSWFEKNKNTIDGALSADEYEDLKFFEGNAQGLRTLTNIESDLGESGMNLTYATIAASIKYPWLSLNAAKNGKPKKHGYYLTERSIVETIASELDLRKKEGNIGFYRHPLAHVMEAADDICYGILDLEDGVEMGIIDIEEVQNIFKGVVSEKEVEATTQGRRLAKLRGMIIDAAINDVKNKFTENWQEYTEGTEKSLIENSSEIGKAIIEAKKLASTKIFNHPRKVEIEIGSYQVISNLLDVMVPAAIAYAENPSCMSYQSQRAVDLIGKETLTYNNNTHGLSKGYLAIRRTIDFISGMTDNYAAHLSRRFTGL